MFYLDIAALHHFLITDLFGLKFNATIQDFDDVKFLRGAQEWRQAILQLQFLRLSSHHKVHLLDHLMDKHLKLLHHILKGLA